MNPRSIEVLRPESALIGSELNHYQVIAPLGSGGGGEVYVAEDTKLKRRVALKLLPHDMAEDPERLARFRREAVAVAALNHPNIVTIHSVEESDGVHFLTMELVDGKPLSELTGDPDIALPTILDIALQLSEALATAHARGITHRDLKPQNVMITQNGAVKILDFGLAKLAPSSTEQVLDSEATTDARTKEGVIVGTFPYMSPEQVRGGKVDPRSDIFSFGVMLYEMASGRKPFTGNSTIELLSSVLKDDPPPVEALPDSVNAVLKRCLAKDPEMRYPTGERLFGALSAARGVNGQSTAGPTASLDVPWIVVRPLKTPSDDEELVAFAEGLTEDIIGGLAIFSHLSVLAESSERRGEERFAIEGTVRKSGKNIRVNIKLLDCKTGAHLWAEHFDRDLRSEDVFAAQDELTDRIVATIADTSGVLTRSLVSLVKAKASSELSALECVLRVFGYSWQWRPDEHAELRTALERALEREPGHAAAWASLSGMYLDEHRFHFNARPDALGRALNAARRAVALDATSQLAYRALTEAHYFRRELGAFHSAADRVLMLNPRDTSNIATVGILLCHGGHWEQGTSVIERAMLMNPHHAGWFYFGIVWNHYRKREYDKALEAAEKINMPGYPGNHVALTATNAQLGNTDAAERHLKDLLELSPRYAQFARRDLSKWFVSDELVEHILEGLANAGLDVESSGRDTSRR